MKQTSSYFIHFWSLKRKLCLLLLLQGLFVRVSLQVRQPAASLYINTWTKVHFYDQLHAVEIVWRCVWPTVITSSRRNRKHDPRASCRTLFPSNTRTNLVRKHTIISWTPYGWKLIWDKTPIQQAASYSQWSDNFTRHKQKSRCIRTNMHKDRRSHLHKEYGYQVDIPIMCMSLYISGSQTLHPLNCSKPGFLNMSPDYCKASKGHLHTDTTAKLT